MVSRGGNRTLAMESMALSLTRELVLVGHHDDGHPSVIDDLRTAHLTPHLPVLAKPSEANARGPKLHGGGVGVLTVGSSPALGSVKLNVLPLPGVLSTSIAPPSASQRCFTIDKPRPVPPSSRERPVSTR